MCFCATIKHENQHLHCVQPQLPHNVEPIFRNHYSGDGKQRSRGEQQPFFFLFKNVVTFFFFSCPLIALSHQPYVAYAVERVSTRDGRLLPCKLDVGEKNIQENKAKQWI